MSFSTSGSNQAPVDGLSQEIVNNGEFSDDGKTFTYTWTSDGNDEVNIDEVMDLLQQRLQRSKRTLQRSSRSFKEDLARHKRYDSYKTRRAVSQCAIEQAAREAEEQAQRERAAKIAALAQQGGYDSACNMLTSQYGESRTEQLIEQLLRQVKEKMTKLREKCTSEGTCGNTSVHIQVGAKTNCPNAADGAPCNENDQPGNQPDSNQPNSQRPAETPNESNPLHKFTARVQAWGKTSGGSWEQSKTTITRKTTQTVTGGSNNSNTNVDVNINANNSGPKQQWTKTTMDQSNNGPNNGPDPDCNGDSSLTPNGPGCGKCRNCNNNDNQIEVIEPSKIKFIIIDCTVCS